jgi:phenylacetate-CoA ligase
LTWNPGRDALVLSASHINRERAADYAREMARRRIELLEGMPSYLERMAQLLDDQGIEPPVRPKTVISRGEKLSDWRRRSIEGYWKCKCLDWYGLEGRAILAHECEKHEGMHLCPDYCITEFIDGGPIRTNGSSQPA